jgi:hypothetical protein
MFRARTYLLGCLLCLATFGFGFGFLFIPLANAVTGLDFPGSAAVATTMRFKFNNPQNNGLPIYGPGGNGVTYIWRVYPRQQSGYYTAFFWGNDDGQNNLNTFLWKNGGADSYYGAHPYPQSPPNGNTHNWEISIEQNDFVNGRVVYNRWYTQAFRVWSDASGKHHEFYWDLPNTDASHMVTRNSPTSWGNTNPPAPALTWGDAPWAPGNEVWNGVIRGIQIYSGLLSLSEILSEAASPLSTPSGSNKIWYLNTNPTPSDIADKSGRGHNPVWVGSERPGLYTSETGPRSSYRSLWRKTRVLDSLFPPVLRCFCPAQRQMGGRRHDRSPKLTPCHLLPRQICWHHEGATMNPERGWGIRLTRDSLASVRYAKRLNSRQSSVIH